MADGICGYRRRARPGSQRVVAHDGTRARRLGAESSDINRRMPWRRIVGMARADKMEMKFEIIAAEETS